MSPSENMEVDARDTERMAAAGAWKAEADSRRARATTAADCMTVCRLRKRERRGVSAKRWQRGRAEGAERAGCGARAPEKRMAGCGAGGVGREGQGEGEDGGSWVRSAPKSGAVVSTGARPNYSLSHHAAREGLAWQAGPQWRPPAG